jgi:glycosyltransferase involved in cell wall biosynthesis
MAGPVKVLREFASGPFRRSAVATLRCRSSTDATVAFSSLQGAESGMDPDLRVEVAWDVPLLDGYHWIYLPNRALRSGLQRFWGLVNPGLWAFVRRERFDVVVCYNWRTASFWIATLAAKSSRASLAFVTDAHTLDPRDGRSWKAPLKRLLIPMFFRVAGAGFAPSTRTVKSLRTLGLRRSRIFLTHHVVDNDFFARMAESVDRSAVRERWRIPSEACVALFVGKLVPWKRPMDLLDAAVRVPELYVVMIGDGVLRSSLEESARRCDLADRVLLLGFTNQAALPGVCAAPDVLVLLSEYEPFGLVVNKAVGRPAVVTRACGAGGDLVQDGVTGHVVDVGDTRPLRTDFGCWRGSRVCSKPWERMPRPASLSGVQIRTPRRSCTRV